MKEDWLETTLGKIAAAGGNGLVDGPFGSNLPASAYREFGIPVIRGSNLSTGPGPFNDKGFVFVEKEFARKLSRSLCNQGDIVFTKKGTLGQTGFIGRGSRYRSYLLSSNQMKLTVNADVADARFVYYFVSSKESIEKLIRDAEATGVPKTNVSYLKTFPIRLPPLDQQVRISSILSSLDDKIELNRRMNETLEAMAQAIFRDWFVDFGPTLRKSGGASDPIIIMGGLVTDPDRARKLADLFPETFGDNGLPEGWEEKPIGEVSEIVGGSTPSTANSVFWENGCQRWATPKDLSSLEGLFLYDTQRRITEAGLAKIGSGLSPAGTVLLSSRAPIGYLAIADEPTAVNQGFIALRPTEYMPTSLALFWCQNNMDSIKANANGSTFQEISKRNFRPLPVVLSGLNLIRAFDDIASAYLNLIRIRGKENQSLVATRDLLLPKFMSGEIRLCDGALEDVA